MEDLQLDALHKIAVRYLRSGDFLASSNSDSLDPDVARRRALRLFALEQFPDLNDPEKLFEQLVLLASDRTGAVKRDHSDPGRILLETLALAQAALSAQLTTDVEQTLVNLLKLAGHLQRPAQPALTILGISCSKPGTPISYQARATLQTSTDEEIQFVPAWSFDSWLVGPYAARHGEMLRWPIVSAALPSKRLVRAWTWPLGLSCDGHAAMRRYRWEFHTTAGTRTPVSISPAETPFRSQRLPASWLITSNVRPSNWLEFEIDVPTCDSPCNELWKADWIQSTKSLPAEAVAVWTKLAPKAPSKTDGTFGWLECHCGKTAANRCVPLLWANVVPAINFLAEGGPTGLPDHNGLAAIPPGECLGRRANGIGPLQEWKLSGVDDVKAAYNLIETHNGEDAESATDFVRRAPKVLRHRGVPVTSADWEEIVIGVDSRIVGCAAHSGYFQYGTYCGQGVELAYHCLGEAREAEALAAELRSIIQSVLERVRPLGVGFRLLPPKLVQGELRISPVWLGLPQRPSSDLQRGDLEGYLTARACLNVEKPHNAETGIWNHLRDDFRAHGARGDLRRLAQEYIEGVKKEMRVLRRPEADRGPSDEPRFDLPKSETVDLNAWPIPYLKSVTIDG